jgi:cobalt-zinc-cadmium efflux system outer membrane protein
MDAAEARRIRARSELRRDATVTFDSVLAATERRLLLEKSLAALQGLARIIEAREKAGEAAGYDRARIALERATVEDQLREASLEERRARSSALRLLGPAATELPNFTAEVAARRPLPDTTALGKELGLRRSDLRALRLDEQGAELAKRAAGRSWIPELTVKAGALILEGAQPGAGTGYVVGVSLPLPIFDHGQGPRARAEARRALAAARYERLLQSAQTQLAATLDSLATRKERLDRHRTDVVARAEELRSIATAGYKGGSADLLALVDAERIARDAGLASVTLSLEVKAAEAELLLISGAYDGADQRSSP